jgi:hypothetical protein
MTGGDSGPVIVPRDSERSLIVRRLLGLDGEDQMPKDKDPLARAQIEMIRAWIDQGAVWPETADAPAAPGDEPARHWAYRRPARPALPAVGNPSWVRTPIDRFILARLEKEGLSASPEASLETLVRRVSLDLIGLPPSPQEVDEVVADAADHGRDAAYGRLVDRLLASPRFGERWSRYWLDLVRYADTNGYERDAPKPGAWKYRDYVIGAINRDMPFDRFTIEQIAGDMLPSDDRPAGGDRFHRNAMTNEEGGIDPEEAHYGCSSIASTPRRQRGSTRPRLRAVSRPKCDPFTQRDYYRMMAFFSNSDYEDASWRRDEVL